MGYIRDQKKRKKCMRKWIRKFIKWGLIIAFVAFLIWWLLHMLGDLQGSIIGLEDQINKQNIELNNIHDQLQETLQENHQLKVKINGISEYIVDQDNVIHDLQGQLNQPNGEYTAPEPKLGDANIIEQPNAVENQNITKDIMKHRDSLAITSLMGALALLGRLALPILRFGAL